MSTEENKAAENAPAPFDPTAFLNSFEQEEIERAEKKDLPNAKGEWQEREAATPEKPVGEESEEEENVDFDADDIDWDNLEASNPAELSDDEKSQKLADLNSLLNTKFTTLEEAQAAVSKDEPKPDPAAPAVESKMLLEEQDQKILTSLEGMLNLDATELMKVKLREEYAQGVKNGIITEGFKTREDGQIIPDEDEITFKLDEIKGDWMKFQSELKSFKGQIEGAVNTLKDKNKTLNSAYTDEKQKDLKKSREAVQGELKNMSNFMGIEVDGKTRNKVYNEIVSGKFFEEITKDDKTVAEMALLMELYKNGLEKKILSKGITSGKKTMFSNVHEHVPNNLGSGTQNPGASAQDSSGFKPSGWADFGYKK